MDEQPTKSSWVRIEDRAGTADIIVGVCYSHPTRKTEWTRPSVGR